MQNNLIETVQSLQDSSTEILTRLHSDFQNSKKIDIIIDNYITLIKRQNNQSWQEVQSLENRHTTQYGKEASVSLNQLLVCKLLEEQYPAIASMNLPPKVMSYLEEDFDKIFKIAVGCKENLLSHNSYIFFSYIEELLFLRFPVGNQNIVIDGFPRSIGLKQKPLQALNFFLLLIRCRGNSPLFQLHYNPHRMRLFNEKGWWEVYELATEMLIKMPEVKGIYASAWFFDPALKKISPEISYLREIVENIGGYFFRVGNSEEDKKNAFSMSKKRKDAYQKGEYIPTGYMMVLPRSKLLGMFAR